jgi:hypothetical protein
MNEDFKMRRRDGPADRREVILVVIDCDSSVQRMLSWVTNLAINEEDLLIDLSRGQRKALDSPKRCCLPGCSGATYP